MSTNSVTDNPTECPACGGVGTDYDNRRETFKCRNEECGVDTFYRGQVSLADQPPAEGYERGADGRKAS